MICKHGNVPNSCPLCKSDEEPSQVENKEDLQGHSVKPEQKYTGCGCIALFMVIVAICIVIFAFNFSVYEEKDYYGNVINSGYSESFWSNLKLAAWIGIPGFLMLAYFGHLNSKPKKKSKG